MRKILFLDRDGTLIHEPTDNFQIDSFEKLSFLPGVIYYLSRVVKELDFELVIITNQDGLGTDSFPEEKFWPAHQKMMDIFESEGIIFKEVLIDKTFAHEKSTTRKPATGLLEHYLRQSDIDYSQCFVIGDRLSDIELAYNMEVQGILLKGGNFPPKEIPEALKKTLAYEADSWEDLYSFLEKFQGNTRRAIVHRKTSETNISIQLDLDQSSGSTISTGIGFFDHMLEQVAKHASIFLKVQASGDLHIDEHHTIEDVALALGEAFLLALGTKRSIARYGHFSLPMDETMAQVALDFSGRPYLVWKGNFTREKVGDMPTEMCVHFFKSFSDAAKCNINIQVEGSNDHHKIEAIFKAFAKSIKMAIYRQGNEIMSTKGVL